MVSRNDGGGNMNSDSYKFVTHRGYQIEPKRDFGNGFFLIDGMPCRSGFVVTKDGCNAMPAATWFQTVADAKESINLLMEVGPDNFWVAFKMRKAAKSVASDLFAVLVRATNDDLGDNWRVDARVLIARVNEVAK